LDYPKQWKEISVVVSPLENIPNTSREILPFGGYLPCGGGGNRWSKNFPVRDFLPWDNYHLLPN